MMLVSLYIYCTEGSCRTEVFAGSTAYAELGVYYGSLCRVSLFGVDGNHRNSTGRAVVGAVVTLDTLFGYKAVLRNPYGTSHLNCTLLGRGYKLNCSGRADLRAACTLGSTVTPLEG